LHRTACLRRSTICLLRLRRIASLLRRTIVGVLARLRRRRSSGLNSNRGGLIVPSVAYIPNVTRKYLAATTEVLFSVEGHCGIRATPKRANSVIPNSKAPHLWNIRRDGDLPTAIIPVLK